MATTTIYRVQAGAYSKKSNAAKMQSQLAKVSDEKPIIVLVNNMYKVQVGAYTIKKNAEICQQKLKKAGFETIIATSTTKVTQPKEKPKTDKKPAEKSVEVSPLKEAQKHLPIVYKTIVVYRCKHKGGAKSLAEIKKKRITTCSTSASVVFQEANILPVGKIVTHTKAVGGSNKNQIKKKNTLKKAMKGYSNLDFTKCKIVKCMKPFAKLSDECKQAGVFYIQDSNACMSAGKDKNGKYWIYSCNESGRQMKNGHYVKNKMSSGYCFKRPILFAIVPLKKVRIK
jgi:hypothetical protein